MKRRMRLEDWETVVGNLRVRWGGAFSSGALGRGGGDLRVGEDLKTFNGSDLKRGVGHCSRRDEQTFENGEESRRRRSGRNGGDSDKFL